MSRDRSNSAASPSFHMEDPFTIRGGCSRMSRNRSHSAAAPSLFIQNIRIHSEGGAAEYGGGSPSAASPSHSLGRSMCNQRRVQQNEWRLISFCCYTLSFLTEIQYSFRGDTAECRDGSHSAAPPSHSLWKSRVQSERIQQNVEMVLILLLRLLIPYGRPVYNQRGVQQNS